MRPIIFCDFDGTITDSDNIIALMKEFAPKGWERIANDVLQKKVSISEGVGKMFSRMKSDLRQDMIDFVIREAKIRPGFRELLQFAQVQHIPFYVVSGGIDFFVQPLLESYLELDHVYCNRADFSGEYIRIDWPHTCDEQCSNDCGCCKPTIMRQLADDDHYKIVIGDSITDLEAAKQADLVFARDFLIEKCRAEGIAFHPFETFFDCLTHLRTRLEVSV
ncbi:2-hydroxy-3-keto-5-methylthiopentenyl-1-phosphate phosphatase [Peribacillus cavernae]|uniref:2-hydroxy-3-keto-5-methylthiopentenyl-1-phosphate phosphatase n=1 Tax=Peribacillus cavernae TaxID=1674310 RepID=A0A3S0VTW7_9BACI|nr:2-hydroxy-3-keto-5-methylthiopentenyl-1-phosphate phosphatase [Peribacillus cavernae]MDQ0217934.1 2-hydroxy-3-keto-5-methylthiopentenyl-1-phosphate phosphatase [Peribacillus cavernae]RUQ32585.1 2-hydroxy-3-keto-5-methylthiopentenyl-1-phosphate phosphatase [Peribacillus cavernae]